ncbi:MAG: DUF2079 domain-containing protein [Elusimicrobia bacterium]|nr:DUF2079 domain-containing protein [Elusimicrobiota bacterium]
MERLISGIRSAHELLLTAASVVCGLGAAALLTRAARGRAAAWAGAIDSLESRRSSRAAAAAALAVGLWFCVLRACMYRAFQLHVDTSILANTASETLRGRWLSCTVDGTPSVLTVHFAFFIPLFLSPLFLLWESALPLLFIQALAVGSTPLAAYLIARRRTGSNLLGWVTLLLLASHPSFHELQAATLENAVFGPPLFLWGLVLWDRGRPGGTALCWALGLTTREQFPFLLAGMGLYVMISEGRRDRRRLLQGAAAVFASAALWAVLMRIVGAHSDALNKAYWDQYAHFGASKTEVIATVLTHPELVLRQIFWPPARLLPVLKLLAGMAFLPLADPAGLAVLLSGAAHQLLKPNIIFFGQTASYAFGALAFATACGLAALVRRRMLEGGRVVWLLVLVLAAASWGFHDANRGINPFLGMHFIDDGPPLLSRIPRDASVWANENVGVWLSARSQAKFFTFSDLPFRFDRMLFRPEYVLVDKGMLIFMPSAQQARLIGFLAREAYEKVAEAGTLILLRDPRAPRGGRSPEAVLPAAADGAALVRPYLARILDSPRARERLAAYPADLRYEPESAEQKAAFALVLMQRGMLGPAIEHGRAAITLRPGMAQGHNNLGNALAAAGELAGAEQHLRAAWLLARLPLAGYNLGNVLIRAGRPGEAVEVLDEVSSLIADPRVFNSLGAAYMLAGRKEPAKAAFKQALVLDPGLADARENLKNLR